jgi:hypothetical protein
MIRSIAITAWNDAIVTDMFFSPFLVADLRPEDMFGLLQLSHIMFDVERPLPSFTLVYNC